MEGARKGCFGPTITTIRIGFCFALGVSGAPGMYSCSCDMSWIVLRARKTRVAMVEFGEGGFYSSHPQMPAFRRDNVGAKVPLVVGRSGGPGHVPNVSVTVQQMFLGSARRAERAAVSVYLDCGRRSRVLPFLRALVIPVSSEVLLEWCTPQRSSGGCLTQGHRRFEFNHPHRPIPDLGI